MAVGEVSAIGYFLPIFAFLLVFIVIYALLKKSEILGGSDAIMLFISFILSSFFIVEAKIVEFVQFSSSGFAVAVIIIFFILAITAFMPGDKPLEFLTKGNWFAGSILGLLVAFFIISSAFIFNWSINWVTLTEWASTDIFGLILLIIIAGVVSLIIKGK